MGCWWESSVLWYMTAPLCYSHDRQQTSSRAETERGVELNSPFEYVLNLMILPKEKIWKGKNSNYSLVKYGKCQAAKVHSTGDKSW